MARNASASLTGRQRHDGTDLDCSTPRRPAEARPLGYGRADAPALTAAGASD